MKNTLIGESSLLLSAQRGDLESFNQLVLMYQGFLFRTALGILGDEDAAADATQDALISAFRNLGSFRGTSLRGWLARITINTCYDQLRRERRHPSVPLEPVDAAERELDFASWLADPADLPQRQVERRELERAIQQGLQRLDPKFRAVAVLVDLQGLSYEEAAEVLRVPVGTVKSRLARARLALRKYLGRIPGLVPWDVAPGTARVRIEELV